MKNEQAISNLKIQLSIIENQVDQIVLSGGKVGYNDPLVREAQVLRTKLNKLIRAGK